MLAFDSSTQKEALEQVVRSYILQHPEIVIEAMQLYRKNQQDANTEHIKGVIASHAAEIFQDFTVPRAGSSDHPVTVIEFFDYRCSFCKRADPALTKLLDENPKLQLIFEELPILGPDSVFAAKAALASNRQGAYLKFHQALMNETGPLTAKSVIGVAGVLGLDVERLKKDMELPEIKAAIEHNLDLAKKMEIGATPSFIIDGELISGVMDSVEFRTRLTRVHTQQ